MILRKSCSAVTGVSIKLPRIDISTILVSEALQRDCNPGGHLIRRFESGSAILAAPVDVHDDLKVEVVGRDAMGLEVEGFKIVCAAAC